MAPANRQSTSDLMPARLGADCDQGGGGGRGLDEGLREAVATKSRWPRYLNGLSSTRQHEPSAVARGFLCRVQMRLDGTESVLLITLMVIVVAVVALLTFVLLAA
jgi:hypothetical protein